MKYLIGAILILTVGATVLLGSGMLQNSAPEFDNAAYEAALADEDFRIKVRSQNAVWTQMHEMANTLIVADQIWGELPITQERINGLILEVTQANYDDKDFLLEVLERWKAGDFSQGVEDHNYLWKCLDGTVGEAYALREEYQ